MRALAAALLLLLTAACGQESQSPSSSAGSASPTAGSTPTPTAAPSATPSPGAVAVVVQDQDALAVVSTASGVLWKANVSNADAYVGGTADRLLVRATNGDLIAVTRDGRTQVGHLDGRVDRAIASPDGRRWAWSTYDSTTDTPAVTSLHVAGEGRPERTLLTNSEDRLFLEPSRWTKDGLWVEHDVSGLGGRYPFGFNTGPVDLVDPDSGQATRLRAPEDCMVADRAADGALACLHKPASAFGSFDAVSIVRSGTVAGTTPLPKPDYASAGNLAFSGDGTRLFVGADYYDGAQDHYRTGVVDARTGALTTLVEGYAPALGNGASALADGSLLLARSLQQPGLWIQAPSGSITQLYASGYPFALVASA